MTPNYEDTPPGPPKRPGMPGWAWALIGCAVISPVALLILAAITFPVFAQAREKARQTSCMSNCKQMSVALLMYMQDHDETMPPKGAKWVDLLQSYQNKPETYKCPSYKSSPFGYAMSQEPLGKKADKIGNPATVQVIFDSNVSGPNALAAPDAVAYRHVRYGNIAFADGHVKATKDPARD